MKWSGWFTAAVVVCAVSVASANVIDPKVNKDAAKLRKDIGKQGAKYVFCLVKAATKCETDGVNATVECHLDTGVVDYEMTPGKATQKFQDAIAKCDDKYNPSKKGTDYTGIGCPGDCDAVTPGVQECANISPEYEATVESTTLASAAKVQLGVLATLINTACGLDMIGMSDTDPTRIDCVTQNGATLSRYGKALFKCAGKCEEDFKDKKGNGGGTNGPNCNSGDAGADANFNTCDGAALTKAEAKEGNLSPTNASLVLTGVRAAVNVATNGLYNRSDPTQLGDPAASPCGNCGNNTREGAEECDGADDAACGVSCNADCTCNP